MRGLLILTALAFFAVGMIVTFSTWTVDGWTVLALAGVLLLGYEQHAAMKLQELEDRRSE